MTYDVWRYIIRGLYEVDKSTFSLLLALKIDMQAGRVRHEEFQCFIKGIHEHNNINIHLLLIRIRYH